MIIVLFLSFFALILFCIPLGAVINANKEKKRRRQNIEDMRTAMGTKEPVPAIAQKTSSFPKNFAELMYGGDAPRTESYRMYGSQQ